jgi:hypothetical protein
MAQEILDRPDRDAAHHQVPGTSKWNKIEHRILPHHRETGAAVRSSTTKPSCG